MGLHKLFAEGNEYVFESQLSGKEILSVVDATTKVHGCCNEKSQLYLTEFDRTQLPRVEKKNRVSDASSSKSDHEYNPLCTE